MNQERFMSSPMKLSTNKIVLKVLLQTVVTFFYFGSLTYKTVVELYLA